MVYNTVIATSNIFPEEYQWPPVRTSESKSQFTHPNRPFTAPQPYRGGSRPSTAQSLPVQPAAVSPLMAQLQALYKRLTELQRQLDEPAKRGVVSHSALEAVAAQLAQLEKAQQTGRAAPVASGTVAAGSGHFESFAKYAAEAARVRNSGRLPFGSDFQKIRLS